MNINIEHKPIKDHSKSMKTILLKIVPVDVAYKGLVIGIGTPGGKLIFIYNLLWQYCNHRQFIYNNSSLHTKIYKSEITKVLSIHIIFKYIYKK